MEANRKGSKQSKATCGLVHTMLATLVKVSGHGTDLPLILLAGNLKAVQ